MIQHSVWTHSLASRHVVLPLLLLVLGAEMALSRCVRVCRQQWAAIKAPAGSTLTIPDPHRGGDEEYEGPQFKALVKARDGRIAAWIHSGHEGCSCKRIGRKDIPRATSVRLSLPTMYSAIGLAACIWGVDA
jgi:hypothetical protein